MSDWAAGWYQDPDNNGQIRYWDGNGWTEHRQAPPEGFAMGQPGPDASGQGTRDDSIGSTSEVDEATRVRPSADRGPETEAMNPSESAGYAAGGAAYGQDQGYGQSPYAQGDYGQSPYGQPGYDQQNPYGQPGYGQPGYDQGGAYGQPGYGQPGYGQPGAYGQQQPYAQGGQQYAYAQGQPGGAPEKKSKTPLLIGLGAAGLVLIVLLGFLGFALLNDDEDPPVADPTTTSSTSEPTTSDPTTSDPTSSDPTTTTSSSTTSSSTSSTSGADPDSAQDKAAEWNKKYTGTGNDTIRVPPGDGAGLVEISYNGDSNFIVKGLDAKGQSSEYLVNAIGKTTGTVAYNLTGYGGGTTALEIETDADWSVTFKKMSAAPVFGSSETGSGYKIFKWEGGKSDLAVKYTAPDDSFMGDFTLQAVGADDYGADRLVSEYEDYEGTTTVQDGTQYLVIEATGDWELTKK